LTKQFALLPLILTFTFPMFQIPDASPKENYQRAVSLLFAGNPSLEDRDDAFNLLRAAAGKGYAPAQTVLGTAYECGTLGSTDIQRAIEWYTKAANQDDWIAQLALGRIYFQGRGVLRDVAAARKWFERAAASGDAASAYYLGKIAEEGATTMHYPEAAKWYQQAAEAGNPFAQERLGLLMVKGLYVPKGFIGSRQEGYAWLLVAADLGNDSASQALGSMQSDIGTTGMNAARRQALEIRDRIFENRAKACSQWSDQYSAQPGPPPFNRLSACESVKVPSETDSQL